MANTTTNYRFVYYIFIIYAASSIIYVKGLLVVLGFHQFHTVLIKTQRTIKALTFVIYVSYGPFNSCI